MENQNWKKDEESPGKKNPILLRKIGIILLVASFLLYGGILLLPFTSFPLKTRIAIGSALAVTGEVSFWIGGIILGKELVARYRKYLNPFHWLKKR